MGYAGRSCSPPIFHPDATKYSTGLAGEYQCAAANPAWRRGWQSWRPVGRVAELGSLGLNYAMIRSTTLILLLTLQVGCTATPELFREKTFTAATFAEAVKHFVALGEDAAVRQLRGLSSDTLT